MWRWRCGRVGLGYLCRWSKGHPRRCNLRPLVATLFAYIFEALLKLGAMTLSTTGLGNNDISFWCLRRRTHRFWLFQCRTGWCTFQGRRRKCWVVCWRWRRWCFPSILCLWDMGLYSVQRLHGLVLVHWVGSCVWIWKKWAERSGPVCACYFIWTLGSVAEVRCWLWRAWRAGWK